MPPVPPYRLVCPRFPTAKYKVLRINGHRQAESEARELRDNLAHLTRVNTLGALSGSLAHELNQPLGIILSNAQAAQELLQRQPAITIKPPLISGLRSASPRLGTWASTLDLELFVA